MKLLRIEIEGSYKGLSNQSFELTHTTDDILTFVGPNGSGKSQFLELVTEVFGYLERARRPDFRTRSTLPFTVIIDYQIRPRLDVDDVETYKITVNSSGNIDCQSLSGNNWVACCLDEIDLPQHVIGYASGLNENLQRSFLKNAVQFYDVMSIRSARRKRLASLSNEEQIADAEIQYLRRYPGIFSLSRPPGYDGSGFDGDLMDGVLPSLKEKDTDIPASIFLDYDCNALLMASLAILPREHIDAILPEIPYRYPQKIEVHYDFRHVPIEEDAIRDIRQLISVVGVDAVEGLSDRTTDEQYDLYELDYFVGVVHIDLSLGGLREMMNESYYGLPIRFFEKLYKIQLLGVKHWPALDKKRLRQDNFFGTVKKPLKGMLPLSISKLTLSNGEDVIDFDDLSDGEAQLVQVVSAAKVFSPDNTLFIFDEPETHLNPSWRTQFHKHLTTALYDYEEGEKRTFMMLSTHSPFLVSSLKKENVFRFERVGDAVAMSPVDSETYGASFDVLIKEYFGLKSLISQTAVEDILKTLRDDSLSNEERRRWMQDNVGDSSEKSYLLRRLSE